MLSSASVNIVTPDLVGKIFSGFLIVEIAKAPGGRQILYCKCVCGVHLLLSPEELCGKKACRNCSYAGKSDFATDEIVRLSNNSYSVKTGSDLIIYRRITNENNPLYLCEFQGKIIECRASDLKTTGRFF